MAEYLPPEILLQIFLNLPTKTLRRIVTVSKSWYSIISSKSFVSAHLIQPPHSENNSFFLLFNETNVLQNQYECSFSLVQESPNQETPDYLRVPSQIIYSPTGFNRICGPFGIANGLILLTKELYYNETYSIIFLWNPAVDVFVKLPNPEIESEWDDLCALRFWFDSRNCDFKVMRIVYRYNTNQDVECEYNFPPLAEVYSMNTGQWQSVNVDVTVDGSKFYMISSFTSSHVYLNGRSHWVGYISEDVTSERLVIVSFDINDGLFREIAFPSCFGMMDHDVRITETMGCLAAIRGDGYTGVCHIWVMKKYGDLSSWTNLCNVPIGTGLNFYPFQEFWKNGDVLLLRDSCNGLPEIPNSSELVRYVPGTELLVDDLDIVSRGLSRFGYCAGKYEESLALLDLKFFDKRVVDENRPLVYRRS